MLLNCTISSFLILSISYYFTKSKEDAYQKANRFFLGVMMLVCLIVKVLEIGLDYQSGIFHEVLAYNSRKHGDLFFLLTILSAIAIAASLLNLSRKVRGNQNFQIALLALLSIRLLVGISLKEWSTDLISPGWHTIIYSGFFIYLFIGIITINAMMNWLMVKKDWIT